MDTKELWIGGRWVPAARHLPLVNPHSEETIARIGYASAEQAAQAIEAAHEAFLAFRKTPAHQRATLLYHVARLLEERKEEAARIIATEAAKPIRAARAEIERTMQTYLFSAEAARSLTGNTVPMDAAPRGEMHMAFTIRQPLGVIAAITPFNFPFNLVAHKVGPAIATGNTMVLKPAEQTPLSGLYLARLFQEAGLPDGVLNIIPGSGQELGETLTTHPKVKYITFTGSPRVGKLIRAQAGLRRVTLELGSNSPLLIDEGFSGRDLDTLAEQTALGAFTYNGQVCISIQRVYVHASIYEPFVEKLANRATRMKIGDPLDEATEISALINESAVERLKQWLSHAVQRGAKVRCGGTFDGNIMRPTVLTDVPADVELNCEEAFGPVVHVTPFSTWAEAIRLANDSKFGLNAGVFTKDVNHALHAAQELETGGVLINEIPMFRVDHMPYGGIKESGVGREGVRWAAEDMTEIKLISFKRSAYE
jgi:acyl-CoA reductase-like NAD-dependent aldehyde dehydrogenase